MDLRESYDSVARAYAEHVASELEHKPLDRHLLNRFAEAMRAAASWRSSAAGRATSRGT